MRRQLVRSIVLRAVCSTVLASSILVLLIGRATPAVAEDPAPAVVVLTGGRILTQTPAGEIEGSILIRDGRIAAVGKVDVPAGAQVIDIAGLVVTPGLIDARSCLWLTDRAEREGANDGGLNALDGVNVFQEEWKEVARQGVTAVYVQPGETGVCGGSGVVLRVAPGATSAELVLKADAGAQAAVGASPRTNTTRERFAEFEQLKKLLESAKAYDETWKKYEAAEKKKPDKPADDEKAKSDSKSTGDSKPKGGESASTKPPARDPAKDFLRRVLSGDVPLHVEAHHEDTLNQVVKWADELKLRLVLEGVSQPRTALSAIQSRRTPLVLGPVIEFQDVPAYRKNRPASWLTALTGDVRWALATFGQHPRESRLLRAQAAAAVALGAPPDQVLRAITVNAAAILGVENEVGSIAVGKQADLAVFAGDPLDPSAPVRLVMSRGRIVYQEEVVADLAPPLEPHESGVASALGAGLRPRTAFGPQGLLIPSERFRGQGDLRSPSGGVGRPAPSVAGALPRTFAIKSTRCWTENGKLEPRTVLVADGRVAAILADPAPASQEIVVDVGSAVVTPGLVSAHSDFGFAPSIDEPVDPDASYLRAVDVFDPLAPDVRRACREGFLGIAFAPGSANVLAGCVGAVRPGAARPIGDDASFIAGKLVLTSESRQAERYPSSLTGQFEVLEQVFSGRPIKSNLFVPQLIQDQLDGERRRHVEALLDRQKVALFQVRDEAEIDVALQLIGKYKFRGVLVGAEEFRPYLDEIKRLEVGLIGRPVRPTDPHRYLESLVAASQAGIPIAFGMGTGDQLRLSAALAVNSGMSREAALLALTGGAAQLLGMPPGIGRIEPGQPADLVIWSGSPLNLGATPLQVLVDGQPWRAGPKPTETAAPAQQRLAGEE